MAPFYASLFMGKFERDFLIPRHFSLHYGSVLRIFIHGKIRTRLLNTQALQSTLWLRFLDDIFFIWDHSFDELKSFIKEIKNFHPNFKFSSCISNYSVNFLDVQITKSDLLGIETDIFIKETNIHQYIYYTSCHPKNCKDGIPYSQVKGYRRITSNDDKFELSLDDLRRHFADRGYPSSVVECAFSKVSKMSQSDALQPRTQNIENIVPFTIVYNPSLPSIGKTIHKYLDILNLSKNPGTTEIFQNFKPMVAFKR